MVSSQNQFLGWDFFAASYSKTALGGKFLKNLPYVKKKFWLFSTHSFTNFTKGIISSNFETFKASLERGQTQPATILKNSVKVELVYEGMKYCIRATQTGKSNYMMELGHSKKDVEVCITANSRFLFRLLVSRCHEVYSFWGIWGS